MTREEAYRLAMRACEETWNEKTCKQIKEALEQTTWIPCPNNDGERELLDRAVKALEAELATKTCNKQVVSKLENAELALNSEKTCNNKQVTSKLVASEDTISRKASIDALKKHFSDDDSIDTECGAYWHHGHVIDVLQGMPPVTQKQRVGRWIDEGYYADGSNATAYRCSECGEHIIEYEPDRYCKFCGAKMQEVEK